MKLYNDDCLEVMKTLEDNSVDSIVTDPPYGLSSPPDIKEVMTHWINDTEYIHNGTGFMNKLWDSFVPNPVYFKEMYRVLKPGGHAFIFAGVRTQDLMGMSLRFAGFEIREVFMWLFSQGFPKSMNISKAIDKYFNLDREVIGIGKHPTLKDVSKIDKQGKMQYHGDNNIKDEWELTKPACELSERYNGFGTAVKPAYEPIILVRKPISEKTIALNVIKHGTGGINIDASRIKFQSEKDLKSATFGTQTDITGNNFNTNKPSDGNVHATNVEANPLGRFPTNVIHDGSDELQEEFDRYGIKKSGFMKADTHRNVDGGYAGGFPMDRVGERDTYGDSGSVSRFFYCAKVSTSERNEGVSDKNDHPTLKPISLLSYLCRMLTPVGGTILDPYMGSGSCGVASLKEGFDYIGIELDEHYFSIAKERIEHHQNKDTGESNSLDDIFS